MAFSFPKLDSACVQTVSKPKLASDQFAFVHFILLNLADFLGYKTIIFDLLQRV